MEVLGRIFETGEIIYRVCSVGLHYNSTHIYN